MKRVISALLSMMLLAQTITPAFASDITASGTSSNAKVPLNVQATTLAVTVPTQLPVTVDSEGNHTYATNTQISNNSSGPIVVSNITMSASSGWKVANYTTDLTKQAVGTKKIGFEINGATTPDGGGAFNDVVTNFGSIAAGGAYKLAYTAKIPPQSQAIDTATVANVVFTVDWYTGGNNSVETEAGALSLDKDLIQMLPGTSEYIRAVYQENQPQAIMLLDLMAEGSAVDWKSSNTSVATVSDGVVTSVAPGNSVITAQAGELTAICHVIVDELRVPITAIDFSKHSTSIVNGASETVLVLYNPEKFTGTTNLTVTSSDTSIATVTPENLNGVTANDGPSAITITGIAPGSAVITATATTDDGVVTSTLNVKIEQPLTGISIEGPTEVKVGETIQLTAKKIPENTTDTSPIVWSSSNDSIATVDQNGLVTGVGVGSVSVTASCGGIKSVYSVEVTSSISILSKAKMDTALKPLTGTITFSTEPSDGKMGVDISEDGNNSIIAVIEDQNAIIYGDGDYLAPADSTELFKDYATQQLDLSGLNTSNVNNMSSMFKSLYNITSLDLSNFDTSNVTNMGGMFSDCRILTNINMSSFNTSNVTDMRAMFYACYNLYNIDLSNFDTSNVTDMGGMFQMCRWLNSLDVSKFNTSKVTDMSGMFNGLSKITVLDLSNFDTSNVTNMSYMFNICTALTKLDVGSFNTSNVTSMMGMFNGCKALKTLDLGNFNTSKVTLMECMFATCSNLTALKISSFDTSNVTNMYEMFAGTRLSNLDLSSFNTSKVTNMKYMFQNCNMLTTVYAKTQADADRMNSSAKKPSTLTVTVKAA